SESTNVLEGSAERRGCTQPRNGNKPAGRNESERTVTPVSVYPAIIAARAGIGVAELEVVGRRLKSIVDQLGTRNYRGSRGQDGSTQGKSRGVTLETPPSPPSLVAVTEDIRPKAEVPRKTWAGSRRGRSKR